MYARLILIDVHRVRICDGGHELSRCFELRMRASGITGGKVYARYSAMIAMSTYIAQYLYLGEVYISAVVPTFFLGLGTDVVGLWDFRKCASVVEVSCCPSPAVRCQ